MSFNKTNFISVNGQPRGSELINDWKYVTSGSLSTLTAADYFVDIVDTLKVGDIIQVYYIQSGDEHLCQDADSSPAQLYTTTDRLIVRLCNNKSRHVAALPVGISSAEVFLNNVNAGDATTITIPEGEKLADAYCILNGKVDSADSTNTVTIKNGATTLFTGEITTATADGAVIKMTKSQVELQEGAPDPFAATEFSVENNGLAALAHGKIAVVVNTLLA